MNVLLTGGTGYIGSHTAVGLVNAGHNVVLFDNLSNSNNDVVKRIVEITKKDISFVKGDLRDTELLCKTIRDFQIEAVFHFAGLKAVGESVMHPLEYYDNNVNGTISLLEAMKYNCVNTIIFSSSATVYGEPISLPIDECHPTCSTSPYGRTKLHIEEMLLDLAASDCSWRIACLRYFNPVGADDSGLIGESPNGKPNNLMPFITQVASGKRPFLNVFGSDYPTSDGTGIRDYIHVLDLAEGHLAAMDFLKSHQGWHAINLGTGRGYSVLEMVNAFQLATGHLVLYELMERRPGDVASCYASCNKAWELLGWRAKRGLNEMCLSAWRWEQANK